jgi:hypothetical protein
MLALILLFLDVALFILSFTFLILDIKNYQENRYEDLKTTELPKRSKFSLLLSLLALVLAVIISLSYS